MSKSVPQLTEILDNQNDDLLHVVRDNIDYKQKKSTFLSGKTYRALISQNAPIASKTSGSVPLYSIWSITTYVGGDDFSNWQLLSGTHNTTGAVYRATSTTPTTWTNSSDLAYDGAPYLTSLDSSGAVNPLVNTFTETLIFGYSSAGEYTITASGAVFLLRKTTSIIQLNSGGGQDNFQIYTNSDTEIGIVTFQNNTLVNDKLNSTFIEFVVYP